MNFSRYSNALVAGIAMSFLVGCAGAGGGDGRLSSETTPLELTDVVQQGLLTGFSLTQIAHVNPPTVNGVTVAATQVVLSGQYAYVSYNVQGANRLGAVETISLASTAAPQLLNLLTYTGYNINSLYVDGDKLYIVGAQSDGVNPPAYFRALQLRNGLPAEQLGFVYLPSFAANNVFAKNGYIYITSGDTGGLTVLNTSNYAKVGTSSIYDARAVTSPTFSSNILTFGAQTGRVLAYDPSVLSSSTLTTMSPSKVLSLGGATVAEAKSTIQSGMNYSVAALGAEGFKIFCHIDGKTLATATPPAQTGVDPLKNVTNSVVIDGGLLYSGNGEGGIYVYSIQSGLSNGACNSLTVSQLGKINFGAGYSVNHVVSYNNTLLVAAGLNGLNIIKVSPPLLTSLINDFNVTILDFLITPVVTLFTNNVSWGTPSTQTVSGTTYW